MGKNKRARSRYTESKEGPRKETKCQGGDQPQAEQPSETKWLTVKVRLSLPKLPRRPLMDRGWPHAPHCCCFRNPDQKSTACPSLTSLSWGSTGPRLSSQLTAVPRNRGGGEGKMWGFPYIPLPPPSYRHDFETAGAAHLLPLFPVHLRGSEMCSALAPSRVGKLGYTLWSQQPNSPSSSLCSTGMTLNSQGLNIPFLQNGDTSQPHLTHSGGLTRTRAAGAPRKQTKASEVFQEKGVSLGIFC